MDGKSAEPSELLSWQDSASPSPQQRSDFGARVSRWQGHRGALDGSQTILSLTNLLEVLRQLVEVIYIRAMISEGLEGHDMLDYI